jgi:hypothetical protein
MTRELAVVHAKEGFRFNALCPAPLKLVILMFVLCTKLTSDPALLSCRTGWETIKQKDNGARYTFPLDALAKLSNRLMQLSF